MEDVRSPPLKERKKKYKSWLTPKPLGYNYLTKEGIYYESNRHYPQN